MKWALFYFCFPNQVTCVLTYTDHKALHFVISKIADFSHPSSGPNIFPLPCFRRPTCQKLVGLSEDNLSQPSHRMLHGFRISALGYLPLGQWLSLVHLTAVFQKHTSRGSSDGIATGYGLDDRGVWNSSPGRVKNVPHSVQIDSEPHPASYLMGTKGFSSKEKRLGNEANHSPPTSVKVKKTYIHSSVCLHGVVLSELSKGTTLPNHSKSTRVYREDNSKCH
jgi:hypothetical protein